MPITHTYVSPVVDDGDPDLVGPDEWNDEHTIPLHVELGGLTSGDDHTQYLLLAGRSGAQQDVTKGLSVSTYARIGNATPPTNVTAGDLTTARLLVGTDVALSALPAVNEVIFAVNKTSTRTTAGDVPTIYGQLTVSPASNSSASFFAIEGQIILSPSTGVTTNSIGGFYFPVIMRNDAAVSSVFGTLYYSSILDSTSPATVGTVTNAVSVFIAGTVARFSGTSAGAWTAATGIQVKVAEISGVGSAGTITTGRSIFIQDSTGTITITTQIGIDIASLAAGSTNFGIRNASNSVQTGYARFGAVTAPTNVTSGDLTSVRLKVGDGAFGTGVEFSVTGDGALSGFLRVGSETAPGNTTAGDLTANRISLGNQTLGASGNFLFAAFNSLGSTAAGAQVFYGWIPLVAPASNSSTIFRAFDVGVQLLSSAGITANISTGFQIHHDHRQTGTIAQVQGLNATGLSYISSSPATPGTVALVQAIIVQGLTGSAGIAGTVTTAYGIYSQMISAAGASFTVTTLTDFYIANPVSGATVTNHIGIDIEALTRGGTLNIGIRNASSLVQSGNVGFFTVTTPVGQRTSGADLTNSVTSGGSNDTIADFTSLTVYATDAATIRNDIYQLARKLKQVNDGLRALGLFT